MGGRANPRLAQSKPPTGKGLRDLNRQRHSLDLHRFHTASHQEISRRIVQPMRFRFRHLVADRLPSISDQSPVYYHSVQVGEVTGHELSDRDGSVLVRIFLYAPHDSLIRSATRFWASSGVQLEVGGQGLKIATESLLTLIAGGI